MDIKCNERKTYPLNHNTSDIEICFCSVTPLKKYEYNKLIIQICIKQKNNYYIFISKLNFIKKK